jgi:Ca2+-binding EF-hand superfamily protein
MAPAFETDNPVAGGLNPTISTGEREVDVLNDADMIAANESEMTDEELADLIYAFQAADMDGGGSIDTDEFATMLAVMRCEISIDEVKEVIHEAKVGFSSWKKMADTENIEKCRTIWDEFDQDKSGGMDLGEINSVITKLAEMGAMVDPFSDERFKARFGDEIDFDEFTAWFLKQEGLPEAFGQPKPGAASGGIGKGTNEKGIIGKAFGKAAQVALGPVTLLTVSAKLVKDGVTKVAGAVDDAMHHTDDFDEARDETIHLMDVEDTLIFAEYVFMMRAGMLKTHLPPNWQAHADDMRKLREAFDNADVDGDNQLELEELEMVILSMNASAKIEHEDVVKLWAVLNEEGKEWIPFMDFAHGMVKVQKDPELSRLIPLDLPNRFQLLSLLIDSPINEEQEKLIYEKLGGLEKMGIKMLHKMAKPPPSNEQIKEMLEHACAGRLHHLTDVQRKAVNATHYACVAQACFIGTFFTLLPGMFENFLVFKFETDGVFDAYWTCDRTIGDPTAAPWGVGNLTLASCDPGLCTSIPINTTYFLALGGNKANGGTWIDKDGPKSLLTGEVNDDCTSLLHTYKADHEPVIWFWVLNVMGIVAGIVFELSLLMSTALRSAVRVSHALDLRLTPLNSDRAFVANMLVRSVFELGDPEDEVMGVESAKDKGKTGRSPFMDVLAILFIKGKVVFTGVLFKQITARVAPYDVATWIKPYTGTMLATALWDSMMCHAIMKVRPPRPPRSRSVSNSTSFTRPTRTLGACHLS